VKLLDQLIPEADLPLDALLIERAAPILRQLENSPVAQVKAERASRFYLGSLNACLSLGNLEVMAQVAKLAMPADGPEPIMEVAELVRAGIGRRDELEALLDVACEMAIELNDGGASEHLSAIVEGLAPQPLISVMVERFMYVEDEARGMLKAILEQKAGADLEALLPLINARSTSFIELGFELLGAFGERGRALIELYLEDGRVVRRRLALKTLRKVVSPNLDAWRAEELRKLESRRRSERLAALSRITCLENDAEAESALLELISAPDFSQRDVDEIERFLCALAMMSPDQGRAVVEELATQRPAGDSAGRKRRQAALRALEHLDELQAGAAASREESTS